MGHSHPHTLDGPAPSARMLASRRRANLLLALVLLPVTLATLIGMIVLWPSGDRSHVTVADPYATAPGVTFDVGTVTRVATETCPSSQAAVEAGAEAQDCLVAYTQPDSGGAQVPVEVTPEIAASRGVEAGDTIRYLNLSEVMPEQAGTFVFVDFVRSTPILLLAVLYSVVVVAVARWRGLRAILGLVGAYAVMAMFILPGLVEGKPPLLLGLVGSSVIMVGVLYFAHGFSARTSTALLGTLFGLAVTALLGAWATDAAYLTGVGDEDTYQLVNMSEQISLSGIIMCGLIISGLGVLNDVTITQSSAVWEMYELAPGASVRRLFTGAMRVGRDHIASTVYTIAFAYAGAALPVLILVSLYERPLFDTLTSGELAEEVVRTLVGSVGLVLAIPMTTLVAVLVVKATGLGRPAAADALADGAAEGAAARGAAAEDTGAGVPEPALPSGRRARHRLEAGQEPE
ncbi:YibE/F family protein [Arthrobacter mobilis]|uniref:YibE/F family protein n=1 Tax=Arthrobacter mobilis TaxID=2724944 RepID=A0A7X6K7V0_9MICC|nr:YibE/F family protein [Arthrobacter mobilis]NKX56770.1 YibE/F family protein [Arthrobacter mobilis]